MAEKWDFKTREFEWNDQVEKKFNQVFDIIDADHNGKLTFDEVKSVVMVRILRLMGQNPTDSEIKEHMDKMDKDGDGAVSRDEFKAYVKEFLEMLQDPQKAMMYALDVMFKACDINENGLISKNEFRSFLKKHGKSVTDQELTRLFTAVDTDGDPEHLTKQELLTIMVKGKEYALKHQEQYAGQILIKCIHSGISLHSTRDLCGHNLLFLLYFGFDIVLYILLRYKAIACGLIKNKYHTTN